MSATVCRFDRRDPTAFGMRNVHALIGCAASWDANGLEFLCNHSRVVVEA